MAAVTSIKQDSGTPKPAKRTAAGPKTIFVILEHDDDANVVGVRATTDAAEAIKLTEKEHVKVKPVVLETRPRRSPGT